MAKDRELQDHERAHSGQPGAKPRHGANVTGSNITGRHNNDYQKGFDEAFGGGDAEAGKKRLDDILTSRYGKK